MLSEHIQYNAAANSDDRTVPTVDRVRPPTAVTPRTEEEQSRQRQHKNTQKPKTDKKRPPDSPNQIDEYV
ncbi:MAG: hypothetical protein V4568_08665 [Pseudomonadota bacterium]